MPRRLFSDRNLDHILEDLKSHPNHAPQVTGHFESPARPPVWGDLPQALHPTLRAALSAAGIDRPYVHQAQAIEASLSGKHVILTTPTASGKTLCYNVPVLDSILRDPDSRAIYLFPTKALGQDQYQSLHKLIEAADADIRTFTFDGDTPPDARRAVRDHGHVVITNPDMLHSGILPQHTRWVKLFESLRYVVIDELHTYRGIFGSNVAHVLRRLQRICRFHGSDPQFICCSATIANPQQLAQELTGLDNLTLIDQSGSPTTERHLVCYNPPVVNPQLGIRAGVVRTSTRLAADLITSGTSTIVFAGSRLHVEVILKYLREALQRAHLSPDLVQGYRGGYLPLHRRRIEAGLRNRTVRAVVATNALELGVDIGSLEACVIAGYPGSIASLWQQSGRAGRRGGRSLTIFVARSSALDQYLVTHPHQLMGASPEHARVNPRNLYVLLAHMKCAAFEIPFDPEEPYADLSLEDTHEVLRYLETHGVVHQSGGQYHWMDRVFPAHHVNLRGNPEENFVVIDVATENILAEVDFRSAHTTLYQHAIYNVDSEQYQVERLDYENHKAYVRRVEPDYYTTAITNTRVQVLDEDATGEDEAAALGQGDVLVTHRVVGFKKVRFHTNENVGFGDIHLPDQEMHTTATWLTLSSTFLEHLPLDRDTAIEALVSLSHALHTSATIALMCAQQDIGRCVGDPTAGVTVGAVAQPETAFRKGEFDPTLFLYDSIPGGVGLAQEIHERFPDLLNRSLGLIEGCACERDGCPACLGALHTYDGRVHEAALTLGSAIAERLHT